MEPAQTSSVYHPHELDSERRRVWDYWLRHPEGLLVQSPNGRIGVVEDARRSLDTGETNALVIRGGMLGRTVIVAPVDQIVAVVPREQRIVLCENPQVEREPPSPPCRPRLRVLPGGLA